jgi:hypothetical protein
MESPSFIHSREEQQRLLTSHEYTGETLSLRYQNCISCHRRTEFSCVKCGYCYSCHWKREQIEDFYVSLSKGNEDNKQQPDFERKDEAPEIWRTLDVLGQPAEPICNYYGCHHKFSLHGSRRCRCKHPTNKALGIQVRYFQ